MAKKLDSITHADLQRAAAVVRFVADRSPSVEEFEYLAALFEQYAELAELYRVMTDDERIAFELAHTLPRTVE
jgi:hypothetical protein